MEGRFWGVMGLDWLYGEGGSGGGSATHPTGRMISSNH